MLATFIQVEPGVIERLRVDPSAAEQLFAPAAPVQGFDTEQMRALIMARGPQLMAGAIDMHPHLREQLERRLGATQDELRGGAGGEAIMRLMQERLGRPPGGGAAPSGRHEVLSLDKAWHGVHYILTGEVEPTDTPLGQAVLGGADVGEDFSGYGPARLFDPDLTAAIALALADPALEGHARARFDRQRMTELQIYPFGWDADSLDWLLSALRDLRRFYADAAARGWAIVSCLE
ncbi:MAG: DUF1877 family protein [Gaiellales bacterium]